MVALLLIEIMPGPHNLQLVNRGRKFCSSFKFRFQIVFRIYPFQDWLLRNRLLIEITKLTFNYSK